MDNSTSHGLKSIVLRTIFVPLISVISAAAVVYFQSLPLTLDIVLVVAFSCVTTLIELCIDVVRQKGGRVVKGIDKWLFVVISDMYSRHYHRYCSLILSIHQHGDAQSLISQAFSLPLPRTFVEPFITPLHHQLNTSRDERRFIWHYLIPPSASPKQDLVILGERGSGKTSLLKHLAIAIVTEKKQRRKFKVPYKLPILLSLRQHDSAIVNRHPTPTLAQIVRADLFGSESARHDIPTRWIENHLTRGHCLVLLDGLDEVADDGTLDKVVKWIQDQRVYFAKNRFIITSRPSYRRNTFTGVTLLENHSFDEDQQKRYIEKWSRIHETTNAHASNKASELTQQLQKDEALSAREVSPLQLIMATNIHLHSKESIQNQIDLYTGAFKVFLATPQQDHPSHAPAPLTANQKRHILQVLAYHMMAANDPKKRFNIPRDEAIHVITGPLQDMGRPISPIDFLEMIQSSSGLLIEQKKDTYSFAHRTFQECLAAFHIKEQHLEHLLAQRLHDTWWHDTIILYCGLSDPTAIITACLASPDTLLLANRCLAEADLTPDARSDLEKHLEEALEKADTQQQRPVIKARLDRRWRHMAELSKDRCIDTSLITYAEYQLFLDDQRDAGNHLQPDHWITSRFLPHQGKDPVLGLRPADAEAFGKWFSALQPGEWRCRLPTFREINHPNAQGAPQGGYWMVPAGNTYACSAQDDAHTSITPTMLDNRINVDIKRAYGYLRLLKLKPIHDCILNPDLDHQHPLDLNHILQRAFDTPLPKESFIKEGSSWVRAHNEELLSILQSKLNPTLASPEELANLPDFVQNIITPLATDLKYLHALSTDSKSAFTSVKERASAAALDMKEQSNFLRWYIRLFALVILDYYLGRELPQPTRLERLLRSHKRQDRQTENLKIIDTYRDLYTHFAILEERIPGGSLQPFEGLLLVKVRMGQTEEEPD